MAVVATAERGLIVYQLENQPSEFRRIDSPLKHQVTLLSPPSFCHGDIKAHRSFYFETWLNLQTLSSVLSLQHRCVAIFKDKQNKPTGFALGSIEGRVAIHYINPPNPWVSNANPKHHMADFEPLIIETSPCQYTPLVLISDPFQSQRQLYL